MNKEHTQQLVAAFPALYQGQGYFECGNGWFDLLLRLTRDLRALTEAYYGVGGPEGDDHFPVVRQVKEKFGTLRFYYGGAPGALGAAFEARIDQAELESARTCEQCGERGRLWDMGWISTLCEKHRIQATRDPLARSALARPMRGTMYGWDLASPEFYRVPLAELIPRPSPDPGGVVEAREADGLSADLAGELVAAYPELFPDPPHARFRCGAGWFPLLLTLIRDLRALAAEQEAHPQFRSASASARGALCVTLEYGSEAFQAVSLARVAEAELQSARTCECCGEPGLPYHRLGVRCPAHREAYVQAELAACIAAGEACGGFDVPDDPLLAFAPPARGELWGWNLAGQAFSHTPVEQLKPLKLTRNG